YARQVRHAERLRGCGLGNQEAEDVASTAFWVLWRRLSEGWPFGNAITDTGSLLRRLPILTRDQAIVARRYAMRQCRNPLKTVPLSDGDGAGGPFLVDPRPALLEVAASREAVAALLDALPTARLKAVVQLLLEDRSPAEI